MGTVISKAANGIGGAIGSVFIAPFKNIFGDSCQGVCEGTWDITCFIEHLCVSNLVKLFLVLVLCYIILLFFYLLFQLGIFQCIGRSLCKMCYAACDTYWSALKYITCFLWYKLKNTKRVSRRRRRRRRRLEDLEARHYSSGSSSIDQSSGFSRKRKSFRMRDHDHDHDHDHDRDRDRDRDRHHDHHHHHHHKEVKTRKLEGKKMRNQRAMSKRRKLMIR